MKTRLLIASVFTVAVALVLAVILRTPANAQEESASLPDDEQVDESSETAVPVPVAAGAPLRDEREDPASAAARSNAGFDGEDSRDGEISVWEEGEGAPPPGRMEESPKLEGEQTAMTVDNGLGEVAVEEGAAGEMQDLDFNFEVEVEEAAVARDPERETITVDFPDEEVRVILRLVADIFELNLVIPETLTGRASIKLRNVSWRQVFNVVLSPLGFTYVEDENIIKVVSVASLTLEPPVTRVVILDYAQAEEIRESIQPMVDASAGGRIQVDKRSNALVITERPSRLSRIEEIINDLDRPNAQVMIESKFVETRNRHLENIGVDWASLDGWGVRAGNLGHRYDRSRISERTGGTESGRESVFGNETTTTTGSSQTSQSTMTSNSGSPPSSTSTIGTSSSSGSTNSTTSGSSGFDSSIASNLSTHATARATTAVFSADQFDVILSALRTTNDVKLVSNPTVVTLNNRAARIHIGEEFPVVEARFNQQTGTYEAGAVRNIDIGITLNVTPQVNNAGFINLDVQPDVSTLTGTVTYFGAEYPIRSTRNARTEVTLKDGYTVAIGGLVQEDTVNRETRVPVLGSIPGVGRLFRSNNNDNDQRNLIIFLTARTLSPDGTTLEETVDPRMIHSMGLRREEIPGYRPDIELWPDSPKTPPATEVEPAAELEVEPQGEIELEAEEEVVVIFVGEEPMADEVAEEFATETSETGRAAVDSEVAEQESGLVEDAQLDAERASEVEGSSAEAVENGLSNGESEPVEGAVTENGDAASATAEAAPEEQPATEEAEQLEPVEEQQESVPSARAPSSRGWLIPRD